jgi:hypothetical protein
MAVAHECPAREILAGKEPIFGFNYLPVFNATADAPPPTDQDDINSYVLQRAGCYVDVTIEVMQPPKWNQWEPSPASEDVLRFFSKSHASRTYGR